MAVSIEEYRADKIRQQEAEAAKAAAAKVVVDPVTQSVVEDSRLTGDEKLDKLVRAIEDLTLPVKALCGQIAEQGMGVMDDVNLKKCQVLYAYNRGRIDAWVEASQIPKRIVAEAKLIS